MRIIQNANIVVEIENTEEIKKTLDVYIKCKEYYYSTYSFRKIMSELLFILLYIPITLMLDKGISAENTALKMKLLVVGFFIGIIVIKALVMRKGIKEMNKYISHEGVNKNLFEFLVDFPKYSEAKFIEMYNYLLLISTQSNEKLNNLILMFDGKDEFEIFNN